MIAFERDFGIWTLDTGTGETKQVSITLRGRRPVRRSSA
jgi:hypothetical protein